MYYKAILYDNGSFEVKEITDEEAYAKTTGMYVFSNGGGTGTFGIRKTKNAAIKSIKKSLIEEITKCKVKLAELENILTKIQTLKV